MITCGQQDRVSDVGCNTGDLSKALYTYLKTVYPYCDIHMLAVDIDSTLIERAKEANENPYIKFMTCNIMEQNDQLLIQITMWIHLNNGDAGLLAFLKYLKAIVIEPQPWKCYRNAQRRVKKSGNSFELYECLKIKSDVDLAFWAAD
ncbi:hypothetical protein HW555_005139 [Spodoptera exigua]|uniref:RNA methyltransferase n=1 Tax=Spodoptera exigua TaxID=7107 RepID=A0A835GK91_SPOEX|nr:hypothetical protein HW555_005139 [Spodoptera exigua]